MSLERKTMLGYFLLTLPALFVFLMIVYYPFINSIFYSFTDWSGISLHKNFVGLENYAALPDDKLIKAGIWNTILIGLYAAIIQNVLSLALALALDSKLRLQGYYKAVFYIPCLFSILIISPIFGNIFQYSGLFNALISQIGFSHLAEDWFGTIRTALPMLMLTNSWQWVGFGSVIYLAGLQSIPPDYYEAGHIDGATKLQAFFKITFPMLMPSVTILTFLNLVNGLKTFELPFVLTNGGPGYATETVGTVIYELGFRQGKMGYASAISVVFFSVIAVVSILQLKLTRSREVEL
ncbi:MAG: sugar ABC transporter permease [Oscillospiraceae bacterium]|nr:sugar ABC transporter permease [Oscillospiraceae bacterium]